MRDTTPSETWQKTACILCSLNCGLEVQVESGALAKIRGDQSDPVSEGYACQKAHRLNYYQNDAHRLRTPLRRRPDGSFEAVSWDTAIREIAARFKALRDTHGGDALAYFGGGGQGNHLGGAYSGAFRAALGTRYIYTSLAQEKTGGFWVDGRLFGKQNCHPTEDVHHADYVLVIGANPWQSHGIPQARTLLQQIAKDPNRTLVVVDPRRTETAEKADLFLQVRPGGDAHMLLAMLGCIVQEGRENRDFLAARTVDFEAIRDMLRPIPVDDYARKAGLDPESVRQVARDFASAKAGCIRTDLGLEHTLHSTLNNYLARLLYLITGQFGRKGTVTFHTAFVPLIGHSEDPERGGNTTKVSKTREIAKLYPPNVLPLEIDTDHPDRIRGLMVDSGNPALTGADSQAYRNALEKLELLVVIDVAMTETARLAHYVLPASSQFEKCEATFFNFEFPENFFHLRRPVMKALEGTLPEPEIYRRLVVALGEVPDRFPLLERIARIDRKHPRLKLFPLALTAWARLHPAKVKYLPIVLYATIGKTLPKGMATAAILWGSCQWFVGRFAEAVRNAGIRGEGAGLAEALFQKVLHSPGKTIISRHRYEDTWNFIQHRDGKIHLAIPEMLAEIDALAHEEQDTEYPFILQAGERRSYNANQIFRSTAWRKKDPHGALKLHPNDAVSLGLENGAWVSVESRRGTLKACVEITGEVRQGMVSLPHGYGMFEQREDEPDALYLAGPRINDLTASDHCDAIAKTPFHKYVPVRLVPVPVAEHAAQAEHSAV
ncbi:MAG: molybdopterin-dependent oxidoreductase [Candidatus Hydrogenedentes bacterium]|nr:molybdopterin-dependent oxidoreductase [Candidatus Hydrogenedentota bacterium]